MEDFGPYRIVRRLAIGGMAEIYLARQRGIEGVERAVVIKRILPTHSRNEEFVTMFLDEARLLAALSHPNIVQVFDAGRVADSYFLGMEYVRGPTLGSLLAAARGPLPFREALTIALAIAEALAYVHERRDELGRPLNIVHRDLNPANVIVSYDGALKLIDFGIAKAATKVYETRTEVIKGTYGYIAPEQQTRAAPVDHRADVFALGVLLYEMCLGEHPFDTRQESNMLDKLLAAKYKRPRQVNAGFPKVLDRLIVSCLAPHPEGRPDGMRTVITEIEGHMAEHRLLPTLGVVAECVRRLVPDTEGPAPLKPLVVPPRRAGAAEPTGTARIPLESRQRVKSRAPNPDVVAALASRRLENTPDPTVAAMPWRLPEARPPQTGRSQPSPSQDVSRKLVLVASIAIVLLAGALAFLIARAVAG